MVVILELATNDSYKYSETQQTTYQYLKLIIIALYQKKKCFCFLTRLKVAYAGLDLSTSPTKSILAEEYQFMIFVLVTAAVKTIFTKLKLEDDLFARE